MITLKMQCLPDERLLEIIEQRYGDEDGSLPMKEIRTLKEVKGAISRDVYHVGNKIVAFFVPARCMDLTDASEEAVKYRTNRAIMEQSNNVKYRAHYRVGDCLMDLYEYNK